jgi:hypothetical protein
MNSMLFFSFKLQSGDFTKEKTVRLKGLFSEISAAKSGINR